MSSYVANAPRRKPVAAGIALMFVLAAPAGLASTWIVDNSCVDDIGIGDADAKTGTLRFCVNKAMATRSI